MSKYCINPIIVLIGCLIVSCTGKDTFSTNLLQKKSVVITSKTFCIDSVTIDTINQKVENNEVSKIFPDIQDIASNAVFYNGKFILQGLKFYTLLVINGENKSLRLIIVKKHNILSMLEVAGKVDLEGYSYSLNSSFKNDSIICTYKIQTIQTDEPADESQGDSIITCYKINKQGKLVMQSSDTIKSKQPESIIDDGEYKDDIFYYNGSNPTSWKAAGINNPKAFKDFFMEFRNMVKFNDKDKIALYIAFPLGKAINEETFIDNYKNIFTNEIRDAVLKQQIRRLFRDGRGVMIGDNKIWFKEIKGKYKIVAIN